MPRRFGFLLRSAIASVRWVESVERRVLLAGLPDSRFASPTAVTTLSADALNDFLGVTTNDLNTLIAGVGNTAAAGGKKKLLVARYNWDGTKDTTFGAGTGRIVVDVTPGKDSQGFAAAFQTDGKLVVGGTVGDDLFVRRFNTNGTTDTTFGVAGTRIIDYSGGQDFARDLIIQPDNKIAFLGSSGNSSTLTLGTTLTRLTSTGALDTTFDGDGKWISSTALGAAEFGNGLALQGSNYLIAGGKVNTRLFPPGINSISGQVMKVRSTGGLDTTWGSGGRLGLSWGRSYEMGYKVAVDPYTSKVVVGGTSANGLLEFGGALPGGLASLAPLATQANFGVARFSSTGILDSAFGTGGKTQVSFGTTSAPKMGGLTGMGIQGNGRIVLGGASVLPGTGKLPTFSAARLLSTGGLDTTYGTAGKLDKSFFSLSEGAFGGYLSPFGEMLLAGHVKTNGSLGKAAIVRLAPDDVYLDGYRKRLSVFGTTGNDTLSLTNTASGFNLTRNGVTSSWSNAQASSLTFNFLAGNDKLTTPSTFNKPIRADGGSGNDSIQGGAAADILTGGLGLDSLFGFGGNDQLFGLDGAKDLLDGGTGTDTKTNDAIDVLVGFP
jgi:uncharacterized delta-60 repeat protein